MSAADFEAAAPRSPKHPSLWVNELPFVALLALIVLGVAYTSFSKQPLVGYWEFLAPLFAAACVAAGWRTPATAPRARVWSSPKRCTGWPS